MRLINYLKHLLNKKPRPSLPGDSNGMQDEEMIAKLLVQVERTEDVELTCDEVLALMDQFAEMVLRGEDASAIMPLVQHHMEMCADCREEFEALLRILESSTD